MSEPLKEKTRKVYDYDEGGGWCIDKENDIHREFTKVKTESKMSEMDYKILPLKDIKSALEWMIQQHENIIDNYIKELNKLEYEIDELYIIDLCIWIGIEYDSIMILEEGLSDVV